MGGPSAQPESSRTLSEGMGWSVFQCRRLLRSAMSNLDVAHAAARSNFHLFSLYDTETEDGEEIVQLSGELS